MEGYRSFEDSFPGLILPDYPEKEKYDPKVALNAAYQTILENFFMSSPETIKNKRKELNAFWENEFKENVDSITFSTSSQYGAAVARAVYAWSSTDSLGYNANLHNYDRNYKSPVGEGKWVTSVYFPMPPLLPYWGGVRTFLINPDEYLAKPLPEYSAEPYQFYHIQALEVLTLSTPLSAENKWIADFWNDDRPGLTFTPGGHWLAITNQVVEKERPPVDKALETYLKVGFALSDAIVACWKAKYMYNIERPETFIQKHISKDWRPYSPTPSFPSYPSGHSMMGAAVAIVLSDLYGNTYKMKDYSHKGLNEFTTEPRDFKSFKEMAEENALSRIFMGVHYRMDCEEGLRLGYLIGDEIVKLELSNPVAQ
jgi:hypothetical protein